MSITDGVSTALGLRLVIEDTLIGFYRQDTGDKLMAPNELVEALRAEQLVSARAEERANQAEARARQAEERAEALAARLRALGIDPEDVS